MLVADDGGTSPCEVRVKRRRTVLRGCYGDTASAVKGRIERTLRAANERSKPKGLPLEGSRAKQLSLPSYRVATSPTAADTAAHMMPGDELSRQRASI